MGDYNLHSHSRFACHQRFTNFTNYILIINVFTVSVVHQEASITDETENTNEGVYLNVFFFTFIQTYYLLLMYVIILTLECIVELIVGSLTQLDDQTIGAELGKNL